MKYALDLLSNTSILDYKLVDTLIVKNHGLRKYLDEIHANTKRYERLVGKLIYFSYTQKKKIAYIVKTDESVYALP
jgi:hypothetical protein